MQLSAVLGTGLGWAAGGTCRASSAASPQALQGRTESDTAGVLRWLAPTPAGGKDPDTALAGM